MFRHRIVLLLVMACAIAMSYPVFAASEAVSAPVAEEAPPADAEALAGEAAPSPDAVVVEAPAAPGAALSRGAQVAGLESTGRYAAMVFAEPGQTEGSFTSEDIRTMRQLLEDPMIGNFLVDQVTIGSGDGVRGALDKARGVRERLAAAAVGFMYVTGQAAEKPADAAPQGAVDHVPGKVQVLIEDRTRRASGDVKPSLAISVTRAEGASAVVFRFHGEASPENTPAGMFLSALKGEADVNRNRRISIGELADALAARADLEGEHDLGELADVDVLKYRTPLELARTIGPEESLLLASKYAGDQRWVEALLMLREIKREKVADPDYRRISETAQINLALEGRYSKDARGDNTARDIKAGLDLIADVLMLTSANYVTPVDCRDLFAGGVRNIQMMLANRKLVKTLIPEATASQTAELSAFLRQTADHVYDKNTLGEADFQMRVKRVIMESEATAGIPAGAIVTEFIYGITAALDPHTDFIPRKAYREFQDETVGRFGGLGIEITLEDKILTVITPLDGTPAAEGGLLPGDRIVAIEGESTEGLELMDAVLRLRGLVGTRVTITIVHRGDPTPVDVTLTRAIIALESIKGFSLDPETGRWNYMLDPADKIAYIRMTDFKENTPADLEAAVTSLVAAGMKGLVLDLRFNHGGLLSSGIKVSDLFVSDGTIVSVRGANSRSQTYRAHYFKTYRDFPLVVLVNEQTASAAEIVAGAMKDHGRAAIVGTRSYGKGTVQTLYELERGQSALKLTTAKYYTPSGISIHREVYAADGGLTPDYEVVMSEEETARLAEVWHMRGLRKAARERILEMERELAKKNPEFKVSDPDAFQDVQLEKALEVIKSRIAGGALTAEAAGAMPST